jgi:UDP-glucose 4-epimerase
LRKQLLWDAMNKFAAGSAEFFGTGQELRDWVHVDDVCRFMGQLLAWPQAAPFEVFNCAGGQAASTADVLGVMAQQVGAPPPRFNGQTRAGDPLCLVADCGKAGQQLRWHAQMPWREGVAQYASWFTQQAAGRTP